MCFVSNYSPDRFLGHWVIPRVGEIRAGENAGGRGVLAGKKNMMMVRKKKKKKKMARKSNKGRSKRLLL
jgi:hypothetical protein